MVEKLSDKLLKRLEDWRKKVAAQEKPKTKDVKQTNFVSRREFGDETEEEHDNRRV